MTSSEPEGTCRSLGTDDALRPLGSRVALGALRSLRPLRPLRARIALRTLCTRIALRSRIALRPLEAHRARAARSTLRARGTFWSDGALRPRLSRGSTIPRRSCRTWHTGLAGRTLSPYPIPQHPVLGPRTTDTRRHKPERARAAHVAACIHPRRARDRCRRRPALAGRSTRHRRESSEQRNYHCRNDELEVAMGHAGCGTSKVEPVRRGSLPPRRLIQRQIRHPFRTTRD